MNRREMLLSVAGGLPTSLFAASGLLAAVAAPQKSPLGICIYCLGNRHRAQRSNGKTDFADPVNFLEYCHRLGAGGVQVPIGVRDKAYATKLRRRAETHEMFVEGITGLPQNPADVERFDAELRTAKEVGVSAVRVVMISGRRYERFDSAEQFRRSAESGLKSLELAEPVAARHRVRLALENHKDQRVPQRLEVLRRISSRYLGTCVDTGNSFALLEDPIEAVRAYAPWAFSVHLKDQAVQVYQDGFLFADAVLGEGFLDLPQMVKILRSANPDLPFCLETITRDPLRVPCLTERYWATFADVPGRDLARTLRIVKANAAKKLPHVSHLPLQEQAKVEDENVRKCLRYGRDQLGL